MNVFALLNLLRLYPADTEVRVDVGGNVKSIHHITLLRDGIDIVLIVPYE